MKIHSLIFIFSFAICSLNVYAQQQLLFGKVKREGKVDDLKEVAFVLSGKKMYEVGFADATYPLKDETYQERGLWCHPVKLLDGMYFEIEEEGQVWKLDRADTFAYHFFDADFIFKHKEWEVVRTDFIVEDESALFSTLKIQNKTSRQRQIVLRLSADIHLTPSSRTVYLKDSPDRITRYKDRIAAVDSIGALMMGADYKLDQAVIRDSVFCMEYTVCIPAGGKVEVPFLLVGDNRSEGSLSHVQSLYDKLITRRLSLHQEKRKHYEESIMQKVHFTCSDQDVTDAFYCAQANVLLNTRDCRPYYQYPYIGAGIPVYPRLFGTDFCFSTPGLLAGGNLTIVRHTLSNLVQYASEHWKGPHEVAADGTLLGWDHIQVSPQLITACWNYYLWTSDYQFLKKIYPFCLQLMDDVLKTSDKDGDLFLEGHGLMEESEFKGDWEELSSTAYLYPALLDLVAMAQKADDKEVAVRYRKMVQRLKKNFNSLWWNPEENIWASALDAEGRQKMYHFWNVVFPLKTGLADRKPGNKALLNIKENWVNNTWGMVGRYWPGKDMSAEGVGLVHNNICSTAAFQWGDTELGWQLLRLTTKGVFHLKHSLMGLFPECQPHLCTNITQLWSYAPFMESIVAGLMGVRPVEGNRIELTPSFPKELEHANLEDLQVGNEKLSVRWQRGEDHKINLKLTYTGNRRDITLHLPKGEKVRVQWER